MEGLLLAAQITAYAVASVVGLVNGPFYQDYLASQAEADPPAVTETTDDAETESDAPEIVLVTD